MEIRIRKTGVPRINGDPGASDVTNTYRVTDNDREFEVTYRSHRFGASLGIAGEPGVLYTDTETNTVRRHVLAVGRGCGIGVESDELVDGLSPWSTRTVIFADRTGEAGEIVLTIDDPSDVTCRPTVRINGRITDTGEKL